MYTNIKDVVFDNKYFWDVKYNPNANISNALPNCTTLAYGLITADNKLPPVSYISNASGWDSVLANGWMAVDYDVVKIEVGDILQWKNKGHVAAVSRIDEGKIILSSSFYTGEHGCSIYNGKYDTRTSFTSLKELSDWMFKNYPKRYFHCWSLDEECKSVGGLPDKILKHPLYDVCEDISRDQIEVFTFEQNVRDRNNDVLKKAEKGFFNVISTKENNGYLWYEVDKDKYIAHVEGRVRFIPASEDDNINKLKRENKQLKLENEELKKKLDKIMEVAKYE